MFFGEDISPDLELAWFGCSDHTLALTHSQQWSLMFGMVEAKRVVLMDWSTLPPSFHKWLAQIFAAFKLERICFLIKKIYLFFFFF